MEGDWALILGASSGFGEATARELSRRGMNIAGVHLDGRSERERIQALIGDLRSHGVEVVYFNRNAADDDNRRRIIERLDDEMDGAIRTMLHSLSFGSIGPYIPSGGEDTRSWTDWALDVVFGNDPDDQPDNTVGRSELEMTMDVMAHSLVYWTQDLYRSDLIGEGSHILAMTSAGSHTAWPNYGAVAAAKGALEAHVRQLAAELGEHGTTVNALQAGVTNTPSLQKIPGAGYMLEQLAESNPMGRTTTTEDVAEVVAAMSRSETDFINGEIIRVDGGEDIV